MNSVIKKAREASARRIEEMYNSKVVSSVEKEKEIAMNWEKVYEKDTK
jgi:hypothetical protein